MMLKLFPNDDLRATAHDRKKEQEKGIHMTPTAMMPYVSNLALPQCGNVVGHPRLSHGQAPYKGAADCGQGQPAREANTTRRGRNPQGRPAPLMGVAARKGGACKHGRLRPARRSGCRPRAHPLAS
ncbi:hypothetical protein B296_00002494, partial [Ensete ventricosum]